MTAVLLLMALVLFCAGVDLNAALPHLGLGYGGTLAAVAMVGALWAGAFGAAYLGLVTALVELCTRVHRRLAICRKV